MNSLDPPLSSRGQPLHPGRGSSAQPANRFAALHIEIDPAACVDEDGEFPSPRTVFLRDDSQTVLNRNDSPDIPFDVGLNPYRGCEHGCAYCYARPTHEYLGYNAGLDFETRIMVKEHAPELLRAELAKKLWKPKVIGMSGVTDCYQPVERKLELTRRCLQVLAEFRNPVAVITKNHLITRDIDVLSELAAYHAVSATISITTLDGDLAKILEPRASPPSRRLAAVRELSAAGIPVGVNMAPVIPGLTDHEMPALFEAAAAAGARDANITPLRLPGAVAGVFQEWLETHLPGSVEKVLGRVRSMRDGKLNDPRFGSRMQGEGFYAEQIHRLYEVARKRAGFPHGERTPYSPASFRVPTDQLSWEF